MHKRNMKPIKSVDKDRTGEHYWLCPNCNSRVGGYVITGNGPDDWGYEKDDFCKRCGSKISWKNIFIG